MFDLEIDRIVEEVRRRGVKQLLVQIPYGLRLRTFHIVDRIRNETSSEVVVSANPCHGACDVATEEAGQINADMILHLGHAAMPHSDSIDVLFVEARAAIDIVPVATKATNMLSAERRIGLMATVQHLQGLEATRQILQSAGKSVLIPKRSEKTTYDGQVLGCDFGGVRLIADQVDAFLVVSGGNFHGLGVRTATGKRTLVCDPFANEVRDMSDLARKLLRKRYAMIDAFRMTHRVGVLIVTKKGQFNLRRAHEIKAMLEERGYECLLLSMDEVRPEVLESFIDLEAFVNTGCPRIALDDQHMFTKPMLNPDEALIAAGVMQWDDYVKEDIAAQEA